MEWRRDRRLYIGVLAPGDEVIGSILAFARGAGLRGGTLHGIGAVDHARLGFFLPAERRYDVREFHENLEVVALVGNLAHTPEGPMVHAHAALGRSDFSLIGGHLFEARTSVTLEIFLTPTAARLERAVSPRFDLKLLRLG